MHDHSVGVDIDATAQWLEKRGHDGAAALLRRIARQRDEAIRRLNPAPADTGQHARPTRRVTAQDLDAAAEAAMLRTEVARLQALAERAGWVADADGRRLWRWREGWWELAYRRRNPRDGYSDTGWYLWGPPGSYDGELIERRKSLAALEADRRITRHLAAGGGGSR